MSTTVQSSAKPASRSSAQGVLRLTRDELRVLHYYRALSDDDREAVRCLLSVLQAPQPSAATSHATPTRPKRTHATP